MQCRGLIRKRKRKNCFNANGIAMAIVESTQMENSKLKVAEIETHNDIKFRK
jgi:hypothetical protein